MHEGDTIIGFTGFFGSGCSFVSNYFPKDYTTISLSEILREKYRQKTGITGKIPRTDLQTFGNELRETQKGSILAEEAWDRIEKS